MRLITARSPISLISLVRRLTRSTSWSTSTLIGPTNTPSTLEAGLYVIWTPERTSTAILLAPSVEVVPEATLDAPSKTSTEVLVHPSTLMVAAYSLCSGTTHRYPSGGSHVVRSLRISTMDAPTQMVGEPPSPTGLTNLVTSKMHSGICNVCTVHSVPSNTTLKPPLSPPSRQWSSTSPSVVTGLDLLTTAAASQELARTPSQTRLTMTVRLPPPLYDYRLFNLPSQTL